ELDQTHIEVFTTKESVTVGGQHFELVLAIYVGNFNNRDIEGTATEIVYSNSAIAFAFIKTVSQRGGCGFVDNAFYVQSGNFTRIFSGLTLGVIEVSRYGNYRFGDFFAEIFFSSFLHFFQDFGRNL